MKREAYSYSCLMLMLPEPLAQEVRDFGMTIPDDRIYDDGSGEKGREDLPHITLKYGLHTSDPAEVASKLAVRPPISATLGRVSVFHNTDCAVLQIVVDGAALRELHKYVNGAFEHTDTHPSYHPHVCVAYLEHDTYDPYWYSRYYTDQFDGVEILFDSVQFSPIQGEKVEIPLNGSVVARGRMEVARMLAGKLDVIISPMEKKFVLSDGRKQAILEGSRSDVDKALKSMKWETSTLSRMKLNEAQKYVEEHSGARRLKWKVERA